MLWQQRLGSDATYNELIRVFSTAGYEGYADKIKVILNHHDDDSDSSCSEESFSLCQPETYPNFMPSSVELPSEVSCKTYCVLDSEG